MRYFCCASFLSTHFGAGGGSRTRTPSLAMDFESTSSANFNTPAVLPYSKRPETVFILAYSVRDCNRKFEKDSGGTGPFRLQESRSGKNHSDRLKIHLYPGIFGSILFLYAVDTCRQIRRMEEIK